MDGHYERKFNLKIIRPGDSGRKVSFERLTSQSGNWRFLEHFKPKVLVVGVVKILFVTIFDCCMVHSMYILLST